MTLLLQMSMPRIAIMLNPTNEPTPRAEYCERRLLRECVVLETCGAGNVVEPNEKEHSYLI
jgi:hypothetical protein